MDPSLFPHGLQFNLPQQKAGGMFGNDGKFGIGQAIVAALNGYLAGTGSPVGMQNMQMMQQMMQAKRQRQQELSDYDHRRSDQNADWLSHQQYEDAHKAPGEFEQRLLASGVQPGTPAWTEAMKAAVQNVTDPVVMTPQGPMLRSQVTGALAQPEILQSLPPGAKLLGAGGPTPPASGGFPY